jgi:hypothetical protein
VQLCRDHRETKKKVEESQKVFQDGLHEAAHTFHRITKETQRIQRQGNGPCYHFWRELSGVRSWKN